MTLIEAERILAMLPRQERRIIIDATSSCAIEGNADCVRALSLWKKCIYDTLTELETIELAKFVRMMQ